MTDAKSYIAARNLRDIFSQLGWAPWDITTVATDKPDRIVLSYRSASHGRHREVMVEPYRFTAWLKPRATRPASLRHELETLLDRKPERPAPQHQGELFPPEALPRAVKESMTPNEL